MRRVLVWIAVVVVSVSAVAATVQTAQAQPWLPDECEGVHWYNPSQVWNCMSAIASSLFGGWSGWVAE